MTATRSGSMLGLFGIIAILIVASPLLIDLCTDLANHSHSDIKHGQDAHAARAWIAGHGDNCKWDCPDGRTRYACRMSGNRWALGVYENGAEVTAFITDSQGYVQAFTAGCKNPMRYEH
jgi:hypothetical protein